MVVNATPARMSVPIVPATQTVKQVSSKGDLHSHVI